VAAVAGAALLTLLGMWVGFRAAGPMNRPFNLGSLSLSISPSFSGKAKVYVPLAGWEVEAPVFSAPFTVLAEPRHLSPVALKRAAHGAQQTVKLTKRELKRAAIIAFVRAFLIALLGALVAGIVVALAARVLGNRWRTALLTGAACLVFALALLGGGGLWVWQSLNLPAFRQAKITLGNGRVLHGAVERLRNDHSARSVIADLSRMLREARR
jgi:hypothetical protein